MPGRKEIIRLDARLVDVLPPSAFVGELANGHRLVAYIERQNRDRLQHLAPGAVVPVDLSPYDMSKGRIVASGGEDAK